MSKSISDYLLSSKDYIEAAKKNKVASHTCIMSGKLTILNKIGNRTLVIPNFNNGLGDPVEKHIISKKLKDAKKIKESLANKLETVTNSISNLSVLLDIQQNLKKKKRWNKEIEDMKTDEIKQNIKKLMQEQAERQKKLQTIREQEEGEILEAIEREKIKEIEEANKRKEEKRQQMHIEAKGKAEERKKYIEGIIEMKNPKKKKLLHEKLAEEYEKNVTIPETERIAEYIASKQKSSVPTIEEIQTHIKEYKKVLQSRSLLREPINHTDSKNFPPSKFYILMNEEEQLAKEMEKIKEAEKLDLITRKNNYAKLIRQLYQPIEKYKSVDTELEKSGRHKKSNETPKKRRVQSMTPSLKKDKSYPNTELSPKVPKPRELPKINYLQQRREQREKDAEDILGKFYYSVNIDSIRAAKEIEIKSRQAEIVFKGVKTTDYNVEASEKLNKMLLDSVKIKLEALHNSNQLT